MGDLRGIASKVSYLKDLGIDGVWLSPIMKSPQADYGYDISDYRDIHYEYGNLTDFGVLLAECQKYDVKLILDLVPNHSSDEHGLISIHYLDILKVYSQYPLQNGSSRARTESRDMKIITFGIPEVLIQSQVSVFRRITGQACSDSQHGNGHRSESNSTFTHSWTSSPI